MDKWEYIKKGGRICPFCESNYISSIGCVLVDNYNPTQEVICNECGGRWIDVYTLTDIKILQKP
jgi:transcription elongation factor Elf1